MSLSLWMRITFTISSSLSQSWSPLSIPFTKRWMRLWNEAGSCLNRSAGTSENPWALWNGILDMNCKNSLKVVTGSQIVSPIATVWKSNIPALSRKVLSLVWWRVLRKFVGSVLKQVSPSQKCSMLQVGRGCSDVVLLAMVAIRVSTSGKWVISVLLEEDFDSR